MAKGIREYAALVSRLQELARQHPGAYRTRIRLLIFLGYAYIALVLVFLLGLAAILGLLISTGKGAYLWVKLGLPILFLIYVVLRSLWVRISPPEGHRLSRREAPYLFQAIEELQRQLDCPPLHRILVSGDFNACVAQVPRLGFLGWHRNYLVVGLPLMQALSPDRFRAILTHEFGHLSGGHGRLGARVYRLRTTGARILETLDQERHWGSFILRRFLDWYVPYFAASTEVLMRAHEFEADRLSASLTSESDVADALIATQVYGRYVEEEFWPGIYKRADHEAEPSALPFKTLGETLRREPLPRDKASRWISEALIRKTDVDDTHPSLAERLASVGRVMSPPAGAGTDSNAIVVPDPPETTAAESFLGEIESDLIERFDRSWKEAIEPQWRERHEYAVEALQKLEELNERASTSPLNPDELLQQARWIAEFRGHDEAVPLFRAFLAANPNHAEASYWLGQMLLERDDPEGIRFIENAMEKEPESALSGCMLIHGFLQRSGRDQEALDYRERAEKQWAVLAQAQQERGLLQDKDVFHPHDLAAEHVDSLRKQLAGQPRVREAYLVRKEVKIFPEKPCYILAIFPRYKWYQVEDEEKASKLAEHLAAELEIPDGTIVFVLNRDVRKPRRRIRKVEGSKIFGKA